MSLHQKLLDIDHPLTFGESKLRQIEAHALIYLSTKLIVGQQKHLDQLEGSVFNFVLYIWIKLKLNSTKDNFMETSGSHY